MAKTGITIYFTEEDKETIMKRASVFNRSQTAEVEFLVREGLIFQDIKTQILLERGIPISELNSK